MTLIEYGGETAEPLLGEPPGNFLGLDIGRVEQGHHADNLTLALKLAGDLVGDHTAGTHAAYEVGALGLYQAHPLDVMCDHISDSGMQDRVLPVTMRLETVDGVIRVQPEGQIAIEHGFAVTVVNQKNGRFVSPLAEQHERFAGALPFDDSGQLFDGRSFDKRGQRKRDSEKILDLSKEIDGT
jgi:hypothetical protein